MSLHTDLWTDVSQNQSTDGLNIYIKLSLSGRIWKWIYEGRWNEAQGLEGGRTSMHHLVSDRSQLGYFQLPSISGLWGFAMLDCCVSVLVRKIDSDFSAVVFFIFFKACQHVQVNQLPVLKNRTWHGSWSLRVSDHVTLFFLGRRGGPKCSAVVVHGFFLWENWTHNPKQTTWKPENSPVWHKHRKQSPTKPQHQTGYLNMVPNQRQWLTPASDWEPYQAQTQKQTNKTSNIECPLRSHPDQPQHRNIQSKLWSGCDTLPMWEAICLEFSTGL